MDRAGDVMDGPNLQLGGKLLSSVGEQCLVGCDAGVFVQNGCVRAFATLVGVGVEMASRMQAVQCLWVGCHAGHDIMCKAYLVRFFVTYGVMRLRFIRHGYQTTRCSVAACRS